MIGLEDRLREVDGVASIRVELSDDTVNSIRIEVDSGVEEATVLEDIRRVLVAYGWRSRRPQWLEQTEPIVAGSGNQTEVTLPRLLRMDRRVEASRTPSVSVRHEDDSMVIVLADGDRLVEGTGSVTPIGAAQAMVKAIAEWHGYSRPDRVSVVMHEMDGLKVVTLMARLADRTALAAEVASPLLHDALFRAADRILLDLNT